MLDTFGVDIQVQSPSSELAEKLCFLYFARVELATGSAN